MNEIELENPMSMNEFLLGAYLTLLMDMISSPGEFGPIPNDIWNQMKETTEIWWEKYYDTLE